MDTNAFNEYLEKRYYDQMNYYDKASLKNQKRYKNFQWILIILSAITPVLAALPHRFEFQYSVVTISAIVAILTTGLKTFLFQELWVSYRSTVEQLKPEINYYNFNVGPYGKPGINKETLFVSRIESILNKEHDTWPISKKIKEQDEADKGNDDTGETTNQIVDESRPALKPDETITPVS